MDVSKIGTNLTSRVADSKVTKEVAQEVAKKAAELSDEATALGNKAVTDTLDVLASYYMPETMGRGVRAPRTIYEFGIEEFGIEKSSNKASLPLPHKASLPLLLKPNDGLMSPGGLTDVVEEVRLKNVALKPWVVENHTGQLQEMLKHLDSLPENHKFDLSSVADKYKLANGGEFEPKGITKL